MNQLRSAWRLFWRIRRRPWRARYRYGCSCEGFTTNNRRAARRHVSRTHWVWDYGNQMWVRT